MKAIPTVLKACTDGFEEKLAEAVRCLDRMDEADPRRGKGKPHRAAIAVFGDFTGTASTEVSRWRNGDPTGLLGPEGPGKIAKLATALAQRYPRQASCFVTSYTYFLLGKKKQQGLATIRDSLLRLYGPDSPAWTKSLKTPVDWIQFAVALHLLIRCREAGRAFKYGWEAWRDARGGFDVPHSAFYCIRRALHIAKEQLILDHRMDPRVRLLGNEVPIGLDAPDFQHYELMPKLNLSYEPFNPGGEFRNQSFGQDKKKTLFYAPELNKRLREGAGFEVLLEDSRVLYEVPECCHAFAWLALRTAFNKPGPDLFNSMKLLPREQLSVETFQRGVHRVQPSSYLATVVTTWSSHLQFLDRRSGEILRLAEANGTRLEPPQMASHYGVMAFIITADSYLVAMYQGEANMVSGGDLVPCGGSTEYYDLERMPALTLGDFLSRAMKREISEEAGIDSASIEDVMSLAYTLDSVKCLKPDFFGVTFIGQTWSEIQHNREELYGGPLQRGRLTSARS
jgi:8-oxo-dGTP pyrophosphatase MutT (NUDIX family)